MGPEVVSDSSGIELVSLGCPLVEYNLIDDGRVSERDRLTGPLCAELEVYPPGELWSDPNPLSHEKGIRILAGGI